MDSRSGVTYSALVSASLDENRPAALVAFSVVGSGAGPALDATSRAIGAAVGLHQGRIVRSGAPEESRIADFREAGRAFAFALEALRMAALWLNHPLPLLDMAERLSVPQRNVFSFYTACAALGLAGPARRAADTLIDAPELTPSTMQSLIARLTGRLGLGPVAESAT